MDISGIGSTYMGQASDALESAKTSEMTEKKYGGSTETEMLDACKKFEAYFIEQVLKEVKKTIPEPQYSDAPTSNLVDFFKDNMVQEISTKLQDGSGLGLAQQMFEQMKRNYSNTVPVSEIEGKQDIS